MKIGSAFPSKYLKADDLQGKEVTLIIHRVEMEDVSGDNSEHKPVMYFMGKQKGLVLNKTNADTCRLAFGSDETEEWHGKSIVIYPATTNFQGRTVPCLRLRVPAEAAGVDDPPF